MPKEEFKQEVEKELTGRETETVFMRLSLVPRRIKHLERVAEGRMWY
jgi:hypothetical protein